MNTTSFEPVNATPQEVIMLEFEDMKNRLKHMEEMNQAFLVKTDKSNHRRQMYEKTCTHKRKLEEQEKDVVMHERKNKSDIEKEQVISQEAIAKEKAISQEAIAKEKAISLEAITKEKTITQEIIAREQAITKEVIAKEEAAAKTLQLRIELAKLTQLPTAPDSPEPDEERPIISAQVLPTVTGITIEDVSTKQNLITGTEQEVYSILSQIGKMVQKPPYNLIPLDTQRAVMYPNGQVHAVNQYCPGDEHDISSAIKGYLYMQMNQNKQARPVTNNHSINKFFHKANWVMTKFLNVFIQ